MGEQLLHFNKQATRWLGAWPDSQLTLKEHHNIRMKKARVAQGRLRRFAGHVGLSPENCRRPLQRGALVEGEEEMGTWEPG